MGTVPFTTAEAVSWYEENTDYKGQSATSYLTLGRRKGLIRLISSGRYQITDDGIAWASEGTIKVVGDDG